MILMLLFSPVLANQRNGLNSDDILYGKRTIRRGCEPDLVAAMLMIGAKAKEFIETLENGEAWKKKGVYDKTTKILYAVSCLQEVIFEMIKNTKD